MATYPLATLGPTITSAGISIPSYTDVLASLQASFKSIFGSDVYLEPDSQDGQFLAIIAQAINDSNQAAVQTYNAYSPATGQGANLSSTVKINGLARNISSASTVDVAIGGEVGSTITNGIVTDPNKNQWAFPASIVIPSAGVIDVTATCQTQGAIALANGTTLQITTPQRGWQTAVTVADAALGAAVETDAQLRKRQAVSTALPSRTVLEGTVGAVWAVTGVTRVTPYENDTSTTDANGIPGNKIYLVVEGGDSTAIANAIASKKTPGTGTYGTTSVTVTDAYGIAHPISFYRPTYDAITCAITLKALAGYTSAIGTAIQNAVAAYVNAVAIGGAPGGTIEWDSALSAAKSVTGSNTFRITSFTLSGPGGAGTPDVPLAFNHAGQILTPSSAVTITPI